MRLELGVLVSGNGTNLQAVLDAVGDGSLDARVRVVISNRAGVRALERAERAGVPWLVVSHKDFASREAFDAALADALATHGAEWVLLAGFMRVLSRGFLARFPHRVLNIHPALLPAFPGTHAIRQALDYGVTLTGCTVHLVDGGVDTGPVLAQRAVQVLPNDSEESLAARIHPIEHELLVETLRRLSTGELDALAVERRRQR